MDKNEFWRTRTPYYVKGFIYAGGLVCIFSAVVTLMSMGGLGILDCVLMLGLAYGIMGRRSRVCAVIAGAYYAANRLLVTLLLPVTMDTGSLVLVCIFTALLILSILGTFAYQNLWDAYDKKGKLPPGPDEQA